MLKLFGQAIEITEVLDCERGGDHRKLVMDARVDCLNRGFNPDERYAVCGRCVKAVSLKV